jgi:uncharacterized protein (TIGR02598 family)
MMGNFFFDWRRRQSKFRCLKSNAFSLVEVVLALGVVAFALVTVLALVPVGLESVSDSLQESQAINVLSTVVADRQASPMSQASLAYSLPALTNTMAPITNNFFGITDTLQTTGTDLTGARYRIDYSFTAPVAGTPNPYLGYFRASWPPASSKPSGFVEIVATFSQP